MAEGRKPSPATKRRIGVHIRPSARQDPRRSIRFNGKLTREERRARELFLLDAGSIGYAGAYALARYVEERDAL